MNNNNNIFNLTHCRVCPRECGANRALSKGICGEGSEIRISKTMLHYFEEPCISGLDAEKKERGSGAVFFSGCPLHCVYCQNNKISCGGIGRTYTKNELADEFLRLQELGAYNINLVSPTHFIPQIIDALDIAKPRLSIPIIFNTGGYEKRETIQALNGYADIFLTDFKYGSSESARKYSNSESYPEIAKVALSEMFSIVGPPVYFPNGIMKSGIILRHLVLPGERKDSINALRLASLAVDPKNVVLSLMSQYTPDFYSGEYKNLHRRVTTFEYSSVLDEAVRLGFTGYSQLPSSAESIYTPDF